ncbi:NAD(P)H-binding protein [Streptomyces sp. NPDC088785]|uniref:NAD(P)H-binding protein n=1 Tax=Streptomyces sp. NPDC088785 TaxID=3365897 RepID=UPI0037F145AD
MILITGATGTVGREVLGLLPAGTAVRVLARRPDRVAPRRGEVVRGDYADPASLRRALTGVRTALLITVRPGADDDARFLRAARAAGVERVVKLSAAAVLDPGADDALTAWQRSAEALLEGYGPQLRWTLLRPRSFMSNTLAWAPGVRAHGVVRTLYGASANSCVDPRDVAACAVRVLTRDGHAGRSYVLTGPRALSAREQTACLGRLLGRRLHHEELGEQEALAAWNRRHPPELAQALLNSARRQHAGAKAQVTDAVRELTGRPPRTYETWAHDHLHTFHTPAPPPEHT